MKRILRHFVVDTFSLFAISQVTTGLVFEFGLTTLVLAGLGVSIATLIVKPVINILLLPINLVTFNLFKWISSAIALYLVTLVVPGFRIESFFFGGYANPWLDIPTIGLSGFLAIIAFSIGLSIFSSLVYWLIK